MHISTKQFSIFESIFKNWKLIILKFEKIVRDKNIFLSKANPFIVEFFYPHKSFKEITLKEGICAGKNFCGFSLAQNFGNSARI